MFFSLLQLVMYQIPFARVVCLVQRTMGAADVSRNCSSSFEEKGCASMESACIPARQGTMDIELQIWTDVQVSVWLLSILFYRVCDLGIVLGYFRENIFGTICRYKTKTSNNEWGWDKITSTLYFCVDVYHIATHILSVN